MSNVSGSINSVANTQKEAQTDYIDRVAEPQTSAWATLAKLVGIYGLVRQYQIQKDYLDETKAATAQAERYLKLAESAYQTISVPTFRCQKALFQRYLCDFSTYESRYVGDAFRLKEYDPKYQVQEGRAISTVQRMFDKARLQRQRINGKYNTGRACHDTTTMLIQQAQAKVAAANTAYRYEEERKLQLDDWYWQRRSAGIGVVGNMRANVITGLNGGATTANDGLGAVGRGVGRLSSAVDASGDAFANMADFWGGISRAGFGSAAYRSGRNNAGGILAAQRQGNMSASGLGGQSMLGMGTASGMLQSGMAGGGGGYNMSYWGNSLAFSGVNENTPAGFRAHAYDGLT